jgi:hypothetical protein
MLRDLGIQSIRVNLKKKKIGVRSWLHSRPLARLVLARLTLVLTVGLPVDLRPPQVRLVRPRLRLVRCRLGRQLSRLLLLRNAGQALSGEVELEVSQLAVGEQGLIGQDVDAASAFASESVMGNE